MKKSPVKKDAMKGTCNFCHSEVDKSKMSQHLTHGSLKF